MKASSRSVFDSIACVPSGVRAADRGLREHTAASTRPVALRDTHERLIQTLWFEGIGIVLVSPLYGLVVGASIQESALLLLAVSLVMMAWAACFNTAFDWLEARKARRCASARPPRWRIVHAFLFETTSTIVTCPLIVALTDLSWTEALAADLLLSLTYVLYGYVFHLGFDRLRPVH